MGGEDGGTSGRWAEGERRSRWGRRLGNAFGGAALLAAATATLAFGGAPGEALGVCGTLEAIGLPGGDVICTHGDDEQYRTAAAQGSGSRSDAPVPVARERCYSDGIAGPRVQVVYLHAAGQPDRSARLRPELLRWARQAEWTVSASARFWGERRHVRWVTAPTRDGGCQIAVDSVALPAADLGDFGRTVAALVGRGYDDTDRKYLLFADSDRYCGLASAPQDDRPGGINTSNHQAGYARVDRPCWTAGDRGVGSVAAHELLHTLGAVQASAPHATGAAHCTDEFDLLCYADGGDAVAVRCEDDRSGTRGSGDRFNRLLDCGGDDYFRPSPAPSSYLATHWNTADSVFLASGESDGAGHVGVGRPDVARDPRGRPQVWPKGDLGGPHRPLLSDAHGWEACELPIRVRVAPERAAGTVGGAGQLVRDVTSGRRPDADLQRALEAAATRINRAVGREVVRVAGVADGRPASGQLDVVWAEASTLATVEVTVRDVRIDTAVVGLDAPRFERAVSGGRETYALHVLALGLGIGRIDGADLMAPEPGAGADASVPLRAMKHLYGGSCRLDPRLGTVTGREPSATATAAAVTEVVTPEAAPPAATPDPRGARPATTRTSGPVPSAPDGTAAADTIGRGDREGAVVPAADGGHRPEPTGESVAGGEVTLDPASATAAASLEVAGSVAVGLLLVTAAALHVYTRRRR